ncbi:MAG: hypothetical protein RI553_05385 [Salibaculum sp.]|uniref:DUF7742 family protein n=1 Tax=Salibaculum sp. TaxID=2855480 RepID=UPI0028701CDC|nr:hypothetical protein [Salibaculum sp.]MDR9427526.1 hypothetical protein [Salibaculum sp.]
MRQPGWHDLDAGVRVLLARPRPDWPEVAAALVAAAHVSDRMRKRLRRPVAGRGCGSLASEAMAWRRSGHHGACDAGYCAALAMLLQALEDWRRDPARGGARPAQPRVQDRQRGRVGSARSRSGASSSPQSVQ